MRSSLRARLPDALSAHLHASHALNRLPAAPESPRNPCWRAQDAPAHRPGANAPRPRDVPHTMPTPQERWCRGCGLSGLALPNLFISASYRLLGQLPKPYLQHIHLCTHSVTHSSHAHDSHTHSCTLFMHLQAPPSTYTCSPCAHTPCATRPRAIAPMHPSSAHQSSHAEPLPPRTSWRPHNRASVAQTPLH